MKNKIFEPAGRSKCVFRGYFFVRNGLSRRYFRNFLCYFKNTLWKISEGPIRFTRGQGRYRGTEKTELIKKTLVAEQASFYSSGCLAQTKGRARARTEAQRAAAPRSEHFGLTQSRVVGNVFIFQGVSCMDGAGSRGAGAPFARGQKIRVLCHRSSPGSQLFNIFKKTRIFHTSAVVEKTLIFLFSIDFRE